MLARLDDLERVRADFAVETTLASRALVSRLARLQESGYRVHIVFLWLPSADMAVAGCGSAFVSEVTAFRRRRSVVATRAAS